MAKNKSVVKNNKSATKQFSAIKKKSAVVKKVRATVNKVSADSSKMKKANSARRAQAKSASSKQKSKSTLRSLIKSAKTLKKQVKPARIRRVLQLDALDNLLLSMASQPYNKILKQIELGKKRLNADRKLALQIGNRILDKAKKVRDSLVSTSKT